MEHRTFVSFEWSEPDEGEFDAAGNIVQPGGRFILEQLRNTLTKRGMEVSVVDMHESYGWCMDVTAGGVPVWCMIQFAEPWLIITDVPLSLWHWLRRRDPTTQQLRVCETIHEALQSSAKATDIQWFSSKLYQTLRGRGGADHP